MNLKERIPDLSARVDETGVECLERTGRIGLGCPWWCQVKIDWDGGHCEFGAPGPA